MSRVRVRIGDHPQTYSLVKENLEQTHLNCIGIKRDQCIACVNEGMDSFGFIYIHIVR